MSRQHKPQRPGAIEFKRPPAGSPATTAPATSAGLVPAAHVTADQPDDGRRRLQHLRLDVTLQAPYLIHGNDPGRHGLHATLLTDPQGWPVLPGTLLAGRIAETWLACGSALGGADADRWFGRPGVQPDRARLMVRDLRLQRIDDRACPDTPPPREAHPLTRVQLDPDTGSVAPGALLMVEQISAPGAALHFSGTWHTWADRAEATLLCRQLHAALLLQTQLGAWRNIGFGKVLDMNVRLTAATTAATMPEQDGSPLNAPATPSPARLRCSLLTTDLLCIGSRSRRGNVFESADHFNGAILLGALAQQLCWRHGVGRLDELHLHSLLARHFDALRCTHALPARRDSGRPLPLPRSLIATRSADGHPLILDAWAHAGPPATLHDGVAFQIDWKTEQHTAAAARQHWGATGTSLRVRTDIDTDGQAKTGALFAYECRHAPQDACGQPQTRWLFDLDLSRIAATCPEADLHTLRAELGELLADGLAPLGKTDALARIDVLAPDDPGRQPVWPERDLQTLRPGERLPLLLITDALLFDTAALDRHRDPDGLPDLDRIYHEALVQLLEALGAPGVLTLCHHFASQRLVGGDWLHQRRQQNGSPAPYTPLVLTEAGSVLVLQIGPDADAARRVLQHWQQHGLDLPARVRQQHGATWRDHPWRPQNGYGEIAVQPAHGFDPLR